MNLFKKIFGNESQSKKRFNTTSTGLTDDLSRSNDLLNPLHPISPFWIGNDNNGSADKNETIHDDSVIYAGDQVDGSFDW